MNSTFFLKNDRIFYPYGQEGALLIKIIIYSLKNWNLTLLDSEFLEVWENEERVSIAY